MGDVRAFMRMGRDAHPHPLSHTHRHTYTRTDLGGDAPGEGGQPLQVVARDVELRGVLLQSLQLLELLLDGGLGLLRDCGMKGGKEGMCVRACIVSYVDLCRPLSFPPPPNLPTKHPYGNTKKKPNTRPT